MFFPASCLPPFDNRRINRGKGQRVVEEHAGLVNSPDLFSHKLDLFGRAGQRRGISPTRNYSQQHFANPELEEIASEQVRTYILKQHGMQSLLTTA